MKNDIIIKLSTPYEACVIDDDNVGLVIPSFCAILRIKKKTKYIKRLNCYYIYRLSQTVDKLILLIVFYFFNL